MTELTQAELNVLDAAAAIITSITPLNASWLIMGSNHSGDPSIRVTYFDTNKEQHSDTCGMILKGDTFGECVQSAIAIQNNVDADAESYKARRIEKLRAELSALEVA